MSSGRRRNSRAENPISAELARPIRLVVFDVDGVLTDGGVYVGGSTGDEGRSSVPYVEFKRFSIQDGFGMKMLMWAGIEVAAVSGRVSEATALRMAELGVAECHQIKGAYKVPVVAELLERKGLRWAEAAMLADDLPDMAVFERVGLRAAVRNAVPQISRLAHWRSKLEGGHGAAREFTDALLTAQGTLDSVADAYVAARSGSHLAGN